MDFETITGQSRKMWVANRGGNNIIKISTDPTNRRYLEKVSGLTSPRGVAFDQDPTPDPVTGLNNCYVYVAEQTRFSRFRAYDTVWVHAVVLDETIAQHTLTDNAGNVVFTLPSITREAMENQIQYDVKRANQVFKQAGIEVRLRDIQWIDDPTTPPDPTNQQGIIMHYDAATLTDEESTLLSTARSAYSPYDINVYYVAGLGHQTSTTPPDTHDESYLFALWGFTYTDDWIAGMDNLTESGIVLCRAGHKPSGVDYYVRTKDASLAHEIAHFLIDWTGADEHSTANGNLMNVSIARTAFTLDSAQINAILNQTESPGFIDHF